MERTREQQGPGRGASGEPGNERYVSLPRPKPIELVNQHRTQANERYSISTSETQGQ